MLKAKNKVGLIFFPAFDWSISPDHPERAERLLYTRDQILEEGLLDIEGIKEYRPYVAQDEAIERTHICVPSVERRVTEAHRIAAGGTMLAADLVIDKKVDRAFALLRPPGHHGNRVVHGSRGFCTINNEAIMADHIRHRLGPDIRIAIVDTDAHHGDGTQDIFYNDPGVLHISIHQDGRTLYPGTGAISERGGPSAYGQTVNIPLPPGTGDEGMLYVMEELVLPILKDWKPDYIINAAGQDNHYSDPLTNMQFSARGYAQLTELLQPDIVVLEGGYSIEGALPYVNVGLIMALAGIDYSHLQEPDWEPEQLKQSPQITGIVAEVVSEVKYLWETRNQADLKKVFGTEPFYTRHRHIYYDTDGIEETQLEKIRLCSNCAGWHLVHSEAVRGQREHSKIAAVLLPWKPCTQCSTEAESCYQELRKTEKLAKLFTKY